MSAAPHDPASGGLQGVARYNQGNMATALQEAGEQARAALRKEHGVRGIQPAEEGFAAARLPDGVYGFTGSPALESPLFSNRLHRNFEVHRTAGGATAVVGFVTATTAAALTSRGGSEPVVVELFPDADGEHTTIVSIPYDRVSHHRQYLVRATAAITLQVLPSQAVLA